MPSDQEETKSYPPLARVPQHVGIIMDGNGRWARRRGLPRLAGHRKGTQNLRRVLPAAVEFGIKILTIYAFSTENWGRPEEEVQGLLAILRHMIDDEVPELHKEGVRLRHLGRLDRIPANLEQQIQDAIELTKDNDRLVLNVAFSYGGRVELVDAIRDIIAEGVAPEDVDEELVSGHLYTAGQSDPDLIIRTSGEMRLSNFLIWQAAYAEFYTTPTLWPDFGKDELYAALKDFNQRDRRFGLVPGRSSD
ncbi:MAG: isoprenyl transferase [Anaerolineae bacterium]|jgi:undecaprenyl diphosphate synthase